MSSTLALDIWFVLILALLCFDPAREPRTSIAAWVPVIWLFFDASRPPAQWIDIRGVVSIQAMEQGNPLDRTVDIVLIVLAVWILIFRSFRWGTFIRENLALTTLFAFALISVTWSDFPFVAFKRWIRDFEGYLCVLVLLSDARPLQAVSAALRRACYLLLPLSILLIRYFPRMGMQYDVWTGVPEYIGVTTSKNMLGVLCLFSGIFFFWDFSMRWGDRRVTQTRCILLVDIVFMTMALWLLNLSNSATSRVCLMLGCSVIIVASSKLLRNRISLLTGIGPFCFLVYLILVLGLGLNGAINGTLGRNATLTDRTAIWTALLNTHTNPFLGTGYQSFWLGHRVEQVWQESGIHGINEAHNGYLDVYLNLGVVGLALVLFFLIAASRRLCSTLRTRSELGSLSLAGWTVLLFYNVTEAALGPGLLWTLLLISGLRVPSCASDEKLVTPQADSLQMADLRTAGVPLRAGTAKDLWAGVARRPPSRS